MLTYDRIKRFYDGGLWTESMVRDAVVKGVITEIQYEEITGDPYTV
jgi:uncharacterized XkdX family phage protein